MLKQMKLVWAVTAACMLAGPAFAHDMSTTQTFNDMDSITVDHFDLDPWKGYADVTVTNNSGQAWGDFHFKITQKL